MRGGLLGDWFRREPKSVLTGEAPLHGIQVKVGEGLPAGGDDVAGRMLVVPELGGDPELFLGESLQHLADLRLVFVCGCAVEMAVTHLECVGDGLRDFVSPESV